MQLLRDKRGQGVFEFVIILPMFLFIIVLCLTFGKLVYAKMTTEIAAREAARTYAVLSNQEYGENEVSLRAKAAATSNLLGLLPVNDRYYSPDRNVKLETVKLGQGSSGSIPIPDSTGDYCQAEVEVLVPIEAPYFRKILGTKSRLEEDGHQVSSDWDDPYGELHGDEYVVKIKGDAVFKKEPRIEGGSPD